MIRLDGSQTSWLIYADWLEDQGIPANHIRDMAIDFFSSGWFYEYTPNTIHRVGSLGNSAIFMDFNVGPSTGAGLQVGDNWTRHVGVEDVRDVYVSVAPFWQLVEGADGVLNFL